MPLLCFAQARPLPLEGSVGDHWHTQQALTYERVSDGWGSWWRLSQSTSDATPFNASLGAGLRLVVASDWVFNGIGWNTAQQGGVIAFYGAQTCICMCMYIYIYI